MVRDMEHWTYTIKMKKINISYLQVFHDRYLHHTTLKYNWVETCPELHKQNTSNL